jgi:hypothetical protein
MADKIFDQVVITPHPRVISAEAARGGPLGGRLLVMMVAAVILCAIASAVIEFIYWARP